MSYATILLNVLLDNIDLTCKTLVTSCIGCDMVMFVSIFSYKYNQIVQPHLALFVQSRVYMPVRQTGWHSIYHYDNFRFEDKGAKVQTLHTWFYCSAAFSVM